MRTFGELPPMVAIREALPWSLIGLAAGVLLFFFAANGRLAGASFANRYAAALLPGFGLMSYTLAALYPYRLAQRLGLSVAPVVAAGFVAFVLARPAAPFHDLETYLRAIGATGLFVAIVAGLLTAAACGWFKRAFPNGIWGEAAGSFCIIALALAVFNFHLSLASAVTAALHPLGSLGDTYLALILIVSVQTLLWTAGVHGPATLAGVVTPVYLFLQQQNTAAYTGHEPLPHIVVVSFFLFVFPGGAGATLPLAIFLSFSRVARLRKIARATILPSFFNINEPLIFGLPLVLNPFLALPFVLAPCVLATITYLCMRFGTVARPAFYYPSSIPTLLSTYLATLDWRAVILVLVNLAVAGAIYLPFVRAYERHEARA